jgi:clan AA aspartic protease
LGAFFLSTNAFYQTAPYIGRRDNGSLPECPWYGIITLVERGKMVGTVFEEITLRNAWDVENVECGLIKEPEIRETTVQTVVDTGAETLVISEAIQKELGLRTVHLRESTLANGEKVTCKIAATVEVCWKNRSMTCRPWVLPGAEEILLGSIPLEDMDLIVDPKSRKLIGAHGDEPLGRIR